MPLLRILLLSAGHLVLAFTTAVIAKGWDMDQLRSRSPVSQVGGVIHDVLMFPHDAALRALPNAWFVRNAHVVVPGAIIMNSLLYGAALYLLWRIVQQRRQRTPRAGHVA